MKKASLVFIAMLVWTGTAMTQVRLFIDEQIVTLSEGSYPAWVFPIAGDLDEALKDLDDFAKKRSDVRMKRDGDDQYRAEEVSIPAISTKRGDLIGYGFSSDHYDALALIYRLGYDISLDSRDWPDEMANFRNYAKAFMAYQYEQSYARRIEDLEKMLKDVEKEKDKVEKQVERLSDDVASLGKKIAREEDTEKINEFQAEINTAEADMRMLMSEIPPLDSQITDLRERIDQTKTESNTYQSTIGTL